MTNSGRSALALAAALLLALTLSAPQTATAQQDAPDPLGAYFDANPELKTTKSSGWKPYQRAKWFHSSRVAPPSVSRGNIRAEILEQVLAGAGDVLNGSGWFSTGPTTRSGRCVAIDFHPTNPDIVYIGSAGGGLWKSTDGGDTWAAKTDELAVLAVGGVCVLAQDPNVVLIGTGEGSGVGFVPAGLDLFGIGLFKSTDGGDTWETTPLSYPLGGTHGYNVIEDNLLTGTILAGANDGLWRSTDQGDTWTQVLSNGNYFDVKWKPGSSSRVYVTKGRDPFINSQTDNGVYVSDDDGLTFSLLGTGQPNGSQIAKTKVAVTPADPEVIYAHYVNANTFGTLGIYRSTDGGATWQLRNSANQCGGQGFYNLILAVSPTDPDRVVSGGNVLYQSNNGGSSFSQINQDFPLGTETIPHWDCHAVAFEPGSTTNLWITNDGGVWRSTDVGATWASRREGIISYQFYDICVAQTDAFFGMGGTQDNGIPGRTGLDEWFESTFIADGMVCNVDPGDDAIVYAEWQGGNHIKSTDSGQSWSSIQNGIFGGGRWVTPVDQDQEDGDRLFTETSSGIFRTTNGGGVWERVSSHRAIWISVNPSNGNVVWTVDPNAGVWRTTDGGDTWTQSATFPLLGTEEKIQSHATNVDQAFVVRGGYATGASHLMMTTDGGASWESINGDFPDQPANTFIVDPAIEGHWYVGSDIGVWRSTDGGVDWQPFGSGLANAIIADLEIRRNERKLIAGTYGRGVWEIDLPASASVLVEGAPERSSHRLMLDAPYRQAGSGTVTFRFAARSETPVRLRIVDIMGRVVTTLVADGRGDGVVRQITWDPRGTAAGVYFASLTAAGEELGRKVLVTP